MLFVADLWLNRVGWSAEPELIDLTAEVRDLVKKHPPRKGTVQAIAIHRSDVAEGALNTAARFGVGGDLGHITGERMPYHVYVPRMCGVPRLTVPLSLYAPHAGKEWSHDALAIAVEGDFRNHAPTTEQVLGAAKVCGLLWLLFGDVPIEAHDMLPNGSADPAKVCPGPYFPMDELRERAEQYCDDWRKAVGLATGALL